MKVALAIAALGIAWAGVLPVHASQRFGDMLEQADAVRSSDPSRFASAIDALETFKNEATPKQLQHLELLKAYRQGFSGRYTEAIRLASNLFDSTEDPTLKFRAALLVANSAAATRDFSLGLRYLEHAVRLEERIDDPKIRHLGFTVIAVLYNQLGQYELGLRYSEQVLTDNPDGRSRCIANQLHAESMLGLKRRQDISAYDSAISDCTSQGEMLIANVVRGYLAQSLAEVGSHQEASDLLETHLAEVEATRYPRIISEVHSQLADYHLVLGALVKAEHHALKALDASRNNTSSLPRRTAYRVLYEIALKRGDPVQALEHYRRYAEADKAYLDDVKARELAFQQSRNEAQQKDQAIALLSKQNEVLKLEQEVATASAQNTRLVILLLGIVLAAIGYWAYKIKRMQVAFRRLAQIDGLTGLCNRRHFHAEAEALLGRCAASGKDAALVLLDLDHFKHINDRHGHATGDRVLKQVAEACQAACRDGDLCGRLGGEEFGILSSGGDIEAARRIAEACRQRLAAIDVASFGHDQPVTASFGCTTASCSGYDFEAMFSEADAAMYRAKHGGRDRIEVRAAAADSSVHEPRIAASHG